MRSLRSRALLFTVVLAALGGALIVAQTNRTSGQKMAEAATKLSGTFTAEQKKQAVFEIGRAHV